MRVVVLHRQGRSEEKIAFLTQSSVRLVKDYLGVYEAALGVSHWQERLEGEIARVTARPELPTEGKKGE